MDNILYRFLADRNTPILDNIKRYCISENKNELTVIGIVLDFLESLKSQLDDNFVKTCIANITKSTDENTKKAFSHFNATQIRALKGCEDVAKGTKATLKAIEGGKGNITELMYFLINSNKTEWEKLVELETMVGKAKDLMYMALLAGLYTSEDSGIEIKYTNHVGDVITYTYNRSNFVQDIELVNAQYDNLVTQEKKKDGSITKEKEELIRGILRPSIVRNEEKVSSVFEYLDSGKEVISAERGKKKAMGAMCFALIECEIFKEQLSFNKILSALAEYWEVKKPAYGKPGEYELSMVNLKNKYLFIEKGIK